MSAAYMASQMVSLQGESFLREGEQTVQVVLEEGAVDVLAGVERHSSDVERGEALEAHGAVGAEGATRRQVSLLFVVSCVLSFVYCVYLRQLSTVLDKIFISHVFIRCVCFTQCGIAICVFKSTKQQSI